jgi:hypothetical protein
MRYAAYLPILSAALLAGCGSTSRHSAHTTSPATATQATTRPATGSTTAAGPGALQAEATAAATGDIPDNQVFLTARVPSAGYSVAYPEGWAQAGAGAAVTFRDKNNLVRIVVSHSARPTALKVRRALSGTRTKITAAPTALSLPGGAALKIVYRTTSAPNPVTGKRVTLTVDRYVIWRAGREAVLDLGTPVGVDNVDAYRMIAKSFRWRR